LDLPNTALIDSTSASPSKGVEGYRAIPRKAILTPLPGAAAGIRWRRQRAFISRQAAAAARAS
jgi:hypothetical protein